MKKVWICTIVAIVIISIIVVTVKVMDSNKNSDNKLNEKVVQEIYYLDNEMLSKINLLNNITFSNYKVAVKEENNSQTKQKESTPETKSNNSNMAEESSSKKDESTAKEEQSNSGEKTQMEPNSELIKENQNIEWNEIKKDIEIIYQSWSTIINDLYKVNANKESIEKFDTLLDNAMIEIKNENKTETIKVLSEMYAQLPIFLENVTNQEKVKIQYVKSYVINGYALVEEDKWEEMNMQIDKAIEQYSQIDNEEDDYKSKGLQLLKELKESLREKDKEIFWVKYKYCFEELIMIERKNI